MYSIGRIESFWKILDVETLPYFTELLTDADTNQWTGLHNLNFSTGSQADYRVTQPDWTPDVLALLEKQNIKLHNVATSFYKLLPGELLPYHIDKYIRYCNYYKVDQSQVYRIIVFLQDWQPGFIFEIENNPVVMYPSGSFVMWHNAVSHMAGNLGSIPRYTLQITGTKA